MRARESVACTAAVPPMAMVATCSSLMLPSSQVRMTSAPALSMAGTCAESHASPAWICAVRVGAVVHVVGHVGDDVGKGAQMGCRKRRVGEHVGTCGGVGGDVVVVDGGVVALFVGAGVAAGVAGAWHRLLILTPADALDLELVEDVVRGAGRAGQPTGVGQVVRKAAWAGLVVGVERSLGDQRLDVGSIRVTDDVGVVLVFHHDHDDRLRRSA